MSFRVFLSNDNLGRIELQVPHVNWQDASRELERDSKYIGTILSYSIALEFTKDARNYIQQAYEIYGQGTDVIIQIYEFNYDKVKYEVYFEGVLDLSTYVIKELTLEVDAIDDRDIQKILNNDDLEINILSNESIDGVTLSDFTPFLRDVTMHSQLLQKDFIQVSDGGENLITDIQYVVDTATASTGWLIFPQLLSTDSQTNDYSSDEIPSYPSAISTVNPLSVRKYILKPEYDGEYTFNFDHEYEITATIFQNGSWEEVRIEVILTVFRDSLEEELTAERDLIQNGDVYFEQLKTENIIENPAAVNKTYNIQYNTSSTISLKKGDRVYLGHRIYFDPTAAGEDPMQIIFNPIKNNTEILGKTVMPETTVKAVYEHDAIARVVDLILGRNGAFKSDFLGRTISYGSYSENGEEISCMLTNGSWLRGRGNGQLVFKLSELFENLRKKYNLGFVFSKGTDGKLLVSLEQIKDIYKDQEIINIGKVVDLIKRNDVDRQYNSVKIGNKEEDTENARSDSDFTNPKSRRIPVESVKNELDLVGTWITNGSVIEEIRRNLFLPIDDQDDKKDNDIFQFITRYDGVGFFSQEGNEAITGEDSYLVFDSISSSKDLSSAYNLRLMPFFLYKKYYGTDIRAIFQKQIDSISANYFDFFLSGVDLNDLEVVENGITYTENGNNSINDYPTPVWLPEIYIFDKELSFEQVKQIANNRIGYISFADRYGNPKQGFLLNVSISDESRIKKCEFELLRKY